MTASFKESKPVFIIGCGRSGTTLLRMILGQHSQLYFPHKEIKILFKVSQRFQKLTLQNRYQEAVQILNGLFFMKKWNVQLKIDDIAPEKGEQAFAKAVSRLMTARAQNKGKSCWGIKNPTLIYQIQFLRRLFPQARFIFIYRDGRNVAMSIAPLRWGPNNVYSAAHWWKKTLHQWFHIKTLLGNQAYDLSYEELVAAPQEQIMKLCRFLDLSYEETMHKDVNIKFVPPLKWQNRAQISQKEVSLFESIAGDTLQKLSYEMSQDSTPFPSWEIPFYIADELWKKFANKILRG